MILLSIGSIKTRTQTSFIIAVLDSIVAERYCIMEHSVPVLQYMARPRWPPVAMPLLRPAMLVADSLLRFTRI